MTVDEHKDRFNMIVFGIVLASVWWSLSTYKWAEAYDAKYAGGFGGDYQVYAHASRGDFAWIEARPEYRQDLPLGWVYKSYMLPVFMVLTLIPQNLWMGIMATCYLILVWKLLSVEYGWMVALLTLKGSLDVIILGNITPLLCLFALSPWLGVLGILVKPHTVILMVCHAWAGSHVKESILKDSEPGCLDISNTNLDSVRNENTETWQ